MSNSRSNRARSSSTRSRSSRARSRSSSTRSRSAKAKSVYKSRNRSKARKLRKSLSKLQGGRYEGMRRAKQVVLKRLKKLGDALPKFKSRVKSTQRANTEKAKVAVAVAANKAAEEKAAVAEAKEAQAQLAKLSLKLLRKSNANAAKRKRGWNMYVKNSKVRAAPLLKTAKAKSATAERARATALGASVALGEVGKRADAERIKAEKNIAQLKLQQNAKLQKGLNTKIQEEVRAELNANQNKMFNVAVEFMRKRRKGREAQSEEAVGKKADAVAASPNPTAAEAEAEAAKIPTYTFRKGKKGNIVLGKNGKTLPAGNRNERERNELQSLKLEMNQMSAKPAEKAKTAKREREKVAAGANIAQLKTQSSESTI